MRSKEHKSTQNDIPLDLFAKHKMNLFQEVQPLMAEKDQHLDTSNQALTSKSS